METILIIGLTTLKTLDMAKQHANKGVARNKKPLQNIVYIIELSQLKEGIDPERFEQYRFKDKGYIVLKWQLEHAYNRDDSANWHGFITPDELKELIGVKQWSKFCNGKREFVNQRRIDGKNIGKTK